MTRPRKHIVCLDETPYYHVTARCVRRAFLCGVDHYSGRSYEHRRDWVEQRIRALSSIFSIDIAAYAVMSNHYHLVVRLAPDEATAWSARDVLLRWCSLFKGPLLVRRFLDGEQLSDVETSTVHDTARVYRQRLQSLSWFMKCLNEPIARRANAEDGCTGHFWEARFRSEPLCADEAVIKAMAYVDLNPIRAGITDTPEASDFTSFRARTRQESAVTDVCKAIRAMHGRGELLRDDIAAKPLMQFADETNIEPNQRLPIDRQNYCLLVDETARCLVPGKRGRMASDLPSVVERLGLSSEQWIAAMSGPRRSEMDKARRA